MIQLGLAIGRTLALVAFVVALVTSFKRPPHGTDALVVGGFLGLLVGWFGAASLVRYRISDPRVGRIVAVLSGAILGVALGFTLEGPRGVLAEVAVTLLAAQVFATTNLEDRLYCSRCGAECSPRTIGWADHGGSAATLRERIEKGDWASIVKTPSEAGSGGGPLTIEECLTCHETVLLTARPALRRLPISRDALAGLRAALAARRSARAEQPEPLVEIGETLRADLDAAREKDLRERHELVPNDDGVVHGPTRAEIIVAGLRALALAPVLAMPAGIIHGVVGTWLGPAVMNDNSVRFSIYGTTIVLAFLIPVLEKLGPRHLRFVRARVFEKGTNDAHYSAAAVAIYALIAIAVVALR